MVSPKVEIASTSGDYGRFVAEPLERGAGITLGNALRRALLSSLTGAAVTWVRIEGIQHEFSTIPHVKEDTTEFLLNIKGLRLRSFSDRPGKLFLEVAGEGRVSAADIKPSADYEIVNPELHLATLDSPEARLGVEFNVERGRGYVPAGQANGLPIGVIPVDAIFTPVRRVNFTLEPTRIGQVTTYERLILEVWTDGTITPMDAVSQSAQILTKQLSLFGELGRPLPRVAEKQLFGGISPLPGQYDMPIEQLGLSVRTLNCLKRGNVIKLGELLEKSEAELLAMKNFGQKSLDELRERLQALGFIAPPPREGAIEVTAEAEEEAGPWALEEEPGEGEKE